MTNRREFIQGAALGVVASAGWPLPTSSAAVAPEKVPRIGVLGHANPIGWLVRTAAVDIEYRWADENRQNLSELAAELAALEVDVIVAAGVQAARAARGATKTIPIAFVSDGDPVKEGLVASLSKPGGNLTGLRVVSEAEMAEERLNLLRHVVPGLRRLAVLSNPANASHPPILGSVRDTAQRRGIEVGHMEARKAGDLDTAVTTAMNDRPDAVLVLPDALFSIHAQRLARLAARNRLPTLYSAPSYVEAGGLMALHGGAVEVVRRMAGMVARMLAGAKPASLPVEHLARLELTVNLRAARVLDLPLSLSLLARADTVVQG